MGHDSSGPTVKFDPRDSNLVQMVKPGPVFAFQEPDVRRRSVAVLTREIDNALILIVEGNG